MSVPRGVYGIGNPLMDVICRVSDSLLSELKLTPGSMNLVEFAAQEEILAQCTEHRLLAGGSCANTIRAVAFLAAGDDVQSAYTGGVGEDPTGKTFGTLLESEGVQSCLGFKQTPTGRSVILVTPDGQRTMCTYLGACRDMTTADVDASLFESAQVFHTTGYMWDTDGQEEAARWAMTTAKETGAIVSFDVADPFVVGRFRDKLLDWLDGRTDLLFANRDELSALVGVEGSDEEILEKAQRLATTVLMKVGARGAYVATGDQVLYVAGYPVTPVDTTGAGDSFAGGYLYGLLTGLSLRRRVSLANAIASHVVQVDGCDYARLDRKAVLTTAGLA